MRYVFLLWGDERAEMALPEAEMQAIVEAHSAFAGRMRAEGRFVAGAGLAPSASATTVRSGAGGHEELVTDGPFIETAEQVGGLYVLECADRDEAVQLARQIPPSPGMTVEIREAPH